LVVAAVAPISARDGPHPRPRIGVKHDDLLKATENWGTYCVTELAPMFREAVTINIKAGISPAPTMLPAYFLPRTNGDVAKSGPRLAVAPGVTVTGPNIGISRETPAGGSPEAHDLKKATPPSGKITVFTAKKLVTMDPGWPEATAVAVADGKILSVGVTFDDLKPWLDKYPYEVDDRFKDKVIYPGFVEAHTHPVMGSLAVSRPSLSFFPMRNPYGDDIPAVATKEEAIARLKSYVAAAKPGETLLTWGYDVVAMGGDLPTASELDGITTTVPLIIWDASEHYAFANGAALKKYNITDDMVAKTIGAGRNPDGSSNGQFLGTDAARLILPQVIAEQMAPDVAIKNLKYLAALMQQAGVTTLGDLFFGGVNIELETLLSQKFFNSPASVARVVHVPDGYTYAQAYGDNAVSKVIELKSHSTDLAMVNGVKFYADDAFVPLSMQLLWPGYIEPGQYKGLFMYSSKQAFIDAMRPWWNAGFNVHVHANGSGGNQVTLDALQALQDEKPRFNHRFTFEHFGISTVAQGRQVKALGALVSTNPYYVYERADLNAQHIGTDRASLASRMSSLIDQDVVVSLHSDTPVGIPSPLLEVWVAVNRIGALSNKTHAPAERVDVARAMKMITIDAAYTIGVEDKVGTIETGKFADFAVLEDDPQTVDPMKIKDIGVVATILGGKVTMTSETRKPDWGSW
jgi:hypothetical protein